MIGRSKKKLLFCDPCGQERWCVATGSWDYKCRECGGKVNVVKAASGARRKRQEARAAKMGQPPPDPAFMAFVADQPCCRPGCGAWPSQAHHTVHRSQGGGDRTCAPLCIAHHAEYHDRLGSVPAALAAWGIDLRAVSGTLNIEFDSRDSEPV